MCRPLWVAVASITFQNTTSTNSREASTSSVQCAATRRVASPQRGWLRRLWGWIPLAGIYTRRAAWSRRSRQLLLGRRKNQHASSLGKARPTVRVRVTARGAEGPQIAGVLRKDQVQRLDQTAAAACNDDCRALPCITEATT
jgi:hypothetical protein